MSANAAARSTQSSRRTRAIGSTAMRSGRSPSLARSATWITSASTGECSPASLVDVHQAGPRSRDVEELLEDLEGCRSGGRGAVPAVLDQRADDELGAVGRPPATPPRLVLGVARRIPGELHDLLRRARLAGDRDRVVAEHAGR